MNVIFHIDMFSHGRVQHEHLGEKVSVTGVGDSFCYITTSNLDILCDFLFKRHYIIIIIIIIINSPGL